MISSIKKRDGRTVPFDPEKIEQAIDKAFMASGSQKSAETARVIVPWSPPTPALESARDTWTDSGRTSTTRLVASAESSEAGSSRC